MTWDHRRPERGATLVVVLAFLALAVPLVTGGLSMAGTLALDSLAKGRLVRSQYAVMGAEQHAIYRMNHEDGYAAGLASGVEDVYTIVLNGREVTVTVLKLSDPPAQAPPPPPEDNRRLRVTKHVVPSAVVAGAPIVVTYTILVENLSDGSENLRKIHDGLPPGFAYVPGSTLGVTSNDPSVTLREDGPGGAAFYELVWSLSSLHITLQPTDSVLLSFQAGATLTDGNYCNEAWVEPGVDLTSTGPTAKVVAGAPAGSLCEGQAVAVTKTVTPPFAVGNTATTLTYTVTIENTGTTGLDVARIRDLLPPGLTYVAGSTSGDITGGDPNTTMFQGRQRLDWSFDPPHVLLAGEQQSLVFDAVATVAPGDYWNEVWVSLEGFEHPEYSWPTARVEVLGVMRSESTDGETAADAEVWMGTDSYIVGRWELTR